MALHSDLFAVSYIPIVVVGLIKLQAPYSNDVSLSMTIHYQAGTIQYSAQEPKSTPQIKETLFPNNLQPYNPWPYATTIPDPSKPIFEGYLGLKAYIPLVNITSDGFIGAAITTTNT